MRVVREQREDLVQRIGILTTAVQGLLVAIAIGYCFLQIVQGDFYRELAENNRLRTLPITAPRGLIFDRKGRLLVENIPSYNLMLDRSRAQSLERSLDLASGVLGRPRAELQTILDRYREIPNFKPVLLAENLSLAEVARIGVYGLEYPEFDVEVQHLRLYRHLGQTAHVLGYVREVAQEEIERGNGVYTVGDLVGKKGIEQTYDSVLRGRDGERVMVVDSRGKWLRDFARKPSLPGRNLNLTIDLDLQQEAAHGLDGPDKVGAVVAMDPRNGEILALVSSPSFNSNLFSHRLAGSDWQALIEAPNHPLQNRALQNAYSPGSTFKFVMATAGLSEGVVDEHTTSYCSGGKSFYGRTFRCHKSGGHGTVDLHRALKYSCDIYFYELGQRLNIERIAKYARLFGLGSTSGIDLSGEKAGLVPDRDWSLAARKMPWYPGETISVAIGQGPLLVTPIQMAVATAMVANGGYRVTPHLVREAHISPPQRVPLDAKALDAVRRGLWAVVNEPGGTAASAQVAGADIAGKTGSVQVIGQKVRTDARTLPFKYRDHGWFVSFAPADDPKIVVIVFAEHGGSGSRGAAPIAKAIYERYVANDRQPAPNP
jgi:penicillin-binding protein 2